MRLTIVLAAIVSVLVCTFTIAASDLSTPKAAALAFARAVEAGNADEAKAVAAADPQNQEVAVILAEVGARTITLREAAKAKFGEEESAKLTGPTKPRD